MHLWTMVEIIMRLKTTTELSLYKIFFRKKYRALSFEMCSKLKYAKDHQVIEVTEQYKYLNAIFSSEFYFFNKHLDGYLSRFF